MFIRFIILSSLFISYSGESFSQLTRFERTGGRETATYFEAIQWYKDLDKVSQNIQIKPVGSSDAGYPLHLVILSGDRSFEPARWSKQNKVVIMINNGIHPGEPDGIDATMMLARDVVTGKIKLPSNIILGIIPVYNIGGCLNRNAYTRANQNGPDEYGFRGNSQNLDLNRDFTKLDSKEAKTFTEIFHYLKPHILIDNHVSDGADYQHTMTLITTQYDKLSPTLGNWVREKFEPELYTSMKQKGLQMIPYVDFENTDFSKGMRMFYDPPRYSSGYASLFNTISFMPETHMLKPYKERVTATYELMKTFINIATSRSRELIENKIKADSVIRTKRIFPLKWIPGNNSEREIDFKGYERDSSLSEATGLKRMFYNHSKPFERKIIYYDKYNPENDVRKPLAYIIPAGWHEVIERLEINGVKTTKFSSDTTIEVLSYRILEYKSLPVPYEKHHKNHSVKINSEKKKVKLLKGDHIVLMNQEVNRYVIEMLEPTGDDSFFAWNFFDGILQQKEGYSDYRWEDIAAGIIRNDPVLRKNLNKKKASEPAFASNSRAILEWIYKNSAYYEKAHMQYPVYRIEYQ